MQTVLYQTEPTKELSVAENLYKMGIIKITPTEWCIKELSDMFATFSLTVLIISENSSSFTSHTFP